MEDFYEYAEEETARADGNQCDNDLPRLGRGYDGDDRLRSVDYRNGYNVRFGSSTDG